MSLLSGRLDRAVVVDVLVSCSVAALATWWWHQFRLGGLVYGSLVGLVLLWRRRRPLLVLAGVTALSAAVAPIEADGSMLHEGMLLVSLAVAGYAAVAHGRTVRAAVAGGAAAWLGAAVLLETRPSPVHEWSPAGHVDLFAAAGKLLGLAAVVWAAALSVRILRQQKATAEDRRAAAERERAQLSRLAVAEERATIARELHDIVAHSLSVMILQANGGAYALDHDPGQTREALRTISTTGGEALEEIRQLVQILRGDGDHGIGHDPASPGRIAAAVERACAAGLSVDLVQDGTPPELPGGIALAVYRIVQESLTNTLKHAGPARSATVHVRYSPRSVDLEVTDDGAGGPPATGGHGLVGMRERALLYGGTFEAGPLLSGGWRVRARIPLAADPSAAEPMRTVAA
jgi:signal transduction histidine kinase